MSGIFNTEVVLDCEVEYTYLTRGRPATGPTYDCGGQPAEAPEFDVKVMANGHDITLMLTDDQLESLREEAADYAENLEPFSDDCEDYYW